MSLFNPYVLIALVLAFLGVGYQAYSKGEQDEYDRQQLEIAKLNAQAREKEQALVAAVNTQTTQLVKAQNEAKVLSQKRNTAIDTGALRLRLPVKAVACPTLPTAPDTAPASGSSAGTTSAELDGQTAKSLIAITDEGDAAIRKLNTCIALYNEAYQTLKGKP